MPDDPSDSAAEERPSLPRRVTTAFVAGFGPAAIAATALLVAERLLATVGVEDPMRLGVAATMLVWLAQFAAQAVVVALVLALLGCGQLASHARGGRIGALVGSVTFLAAALGLMSGFFVGGTLDDGDWVAGQSWAWSIRWVFAGALALSLGVLAWLCVRFPAAGRRRDAVGWRRIGLSIALCLAAAGLVILNAKLMPGRFPEFHSFCFAMAVLLAGLGASRLLRERLSRLPGLVTAVLAAGLLAALLAAGSIAVLGDSGTRSEALQQSIVTEDVAGTLGISEGGDTALETELRTLDVHAGSIETRDPLPRNLLPQRAPNGKPWNVAVILVDTLRADALLPVRTKDMKFAKMGDTPNIDQWTSTTYRFSRARSQASATKRSIPAMFRSIHPFEIKTGAGVPLAEHMRSLDVTTAAVVTNYLVSATGHVAEEVLGGFDEVSTYGRDESELAVDRTDEMLDVLGGEQFFLFVHYFHMHEPCYDGEMLSSKDGRLHERYRRALVWFDGQLPRLLETFDRRGVAENTIIILTSDHGESLGANNISTHSVTTFEEVLRVPLLIYIPGRDGAEIGEVVGTADLLPTITEIYGGDLQPGHRGKSLAPLIAGVSSDWSGPYYFENGRSGSKLVMAVVDGHDKLIYKRRNQRFMRFDVEADPRENDDLYSETGDVDRRLLRHLMRINPEPFVAELEDEEVVDLLLSRLREVDATRPGEALPWLLRLACLEGGAQTREQAERIFLEAEDDRIKVEVLRSCRRTRPISKWTRLAQGHMNDVAGTARELEFVAALATMNQPPVGRKFLAERVAWWAENGSATDMVPWLALIRARPKVTASHVGDSLLAVLARIPEAGTHADSDPELHALLSTMAAVADDEQSKRVRARMVRAMRRFNEHPDPRIRAQALRVVGAHGTSTAIPSVQSEFDDATSPRVRKAALWALAQLGGSEAVEQLIQIAQTDPFLEVDCVRLIGQVGDRAAIPFLEDVQANHGKRVMRNAAMGAIKTIEARTAADDDAPDSANADAGEGIR